MKKVIIFGGALLGFTLLANAAWVRDGSVKSTEKSVSSLATLVEERSIVLGSLKIASAPKEASIGALAGKFSGSVGAKAISTVWKDSGSDMASLVEVGGFEAKQGQPLPEAGTWAAVGFVAVVAFGNWRMRQGRR